jgi:oligoribonuclease NrnB/cAMP/cGMP phosphodiesterase (DHH superfamily)
MNSTKSTLTKTPIQPDRRIEKGKYQVSQITCIYHGNCADGFGAAWVVREAAKKLEWSMIPTFHSGVYQKPPPWEIIDDCDVIIVDFSYKRPIMEEIYKRCNTLCWIDHHKSAVEDMKDFEFGRGTFYKHTNLNHSGAMLAWRYFFNDQEPPQLLKHIEDRDLWSFKLPGTREIQAAIFSYPYDFAVWDKLMAEEDLTSLIHAGMAIERKHFKDIKELLIVMQRRVIIGGIMVPVANLPYTMASDAGHIMAQEAPFAATYYDKPEGRVFSLRSKEGGWDVSLIAKDYGGGGHKHAAGFEVPRSDPLACF